MLRWAVQDVGEGRGGQARRVMGVCEARQLTG